MTTPDEHDERVRGGVAFLDSIRERSWRGEAVGAAMARRGALLHSVAELASFSIERDTDPARVHAWDLERGFTIDYSGLGYPPADGPTSRPWRERRALAELEAAWWRAVAP